MLLSHVYLPSRTIQWIMGCSFPINMWVQRRFFCQGKKVKFCCLKIRDTNPVAHDNVNEACEKRCYCLWRLFPPFFHHMSKKGISSYWILQFKLPKMSIQDASFSTSWQMAHCVIDRWSCIFQLRINHWWIFIGWKIVTTRPQYLLFANII